MRPWLAAAIGALIPTLAVAQPAGRPVVGELFTSEGCSSCPPADAKIAELAQTRPDLLLLTFHVTYWNYLGWRDPYSFDAATERQRRYVALGVSPEVYTPFDTFIRGHAEHPAFVCTAEPVRPDMRRFNQKRPVRYHLQAISTERRPRAVVTAYDTPLTRQR